MKEHDYLTAEEQAILESGQDKEQLSSMTVRALKAELMLAEAAHENQRQESMKIMIGLQIAHGIEPHENAYLEKMENGRIRWVVSRAESTPFLGNAVPKEQ